jgi:hypothetical protein
MSKFSPNLLVEFPGVLSKVQIHSKLEKQFSFDFFLGVGPSGQRVIGAVSEICFPLWFAPSDLITSSLLSH